VENHDTAADATEADQRFVNDWQRWREQREHGLRLPYGWLSLTALHWLATAPSTFTTVPGRWRAEGDTVIVETVAADGLTYGGEPVDGELRVPAVGGAAEHQVIWGDVRIELISRGRWLALRVRDPHSPTLAGFTGVPAYEPSTRWAVQGRFEPYESARQVTVGSVVDGLTHGETAVGVLRFAVDGQEHRLVAFDGTDGDLDVLFRDATSGVTTYGASRSLTVSAPAADGRVVLDFNRAYNMPCAFTDFATCPLPPGENVLPIAVTAGERKPR
jgi:uncharacterized protein (DUF1684 family)